MTDPKSQTGKTSTGETKVEDATIIDVEPTRVSEEPADGCEDAPLTRCSPYQRRVCVGRFIVLVNH